MLKNILFFVGVSLVAQVSAAPGGWTPTPQKISGIVIEGSETNGTALILIDGGVPADYIPSECNSPYNTADLTTEKGRGILSVALSARLADKPVKLALTCRGSRPFITHIML